MFNLWRNNIDDMELFSEIVLSIEMFFLMSNVFLNAIALYGII